MATFRKRGNLQWEARIRKRGYPMQEALRQMNWRIYGPRGAAKLLGINPTTLISRLKKLGIYVSRVQPQE